MIHTTTIREMSTTVREMFSLAHVVSWQMHGFLILDVLTIWLPIGNGSPLTSQVILVMFIWVMTKRVLLLEWDKCKLLWMMVEWECCVMSDISLSWGRIWSHLVPCKLMVSVTKLIEIEIPSKYVRVSWFTIDCRKYLYAIGEHSCKLSYIC